MVVPLKNPGKFVFYKRFISQDRCIELLKEVLEYRDYKQYLFKKTYKEPRVHVLFSSRSKHDIGYMYHGTHIKSNPISDVPSVKELADDIGRYVGLPQFEWNIGVDVMVYRDGNDRIDWHADDTQGESVIFSVVLESPTDGQYDNRTSRPLLIKTKRKKNTQQHNGDELVTVTLLVIGTSGVVHPYFRESTDARRVFSARNACIFGAAVVFSRTVK